MLSPPSLLVLVSSLPLTRPFIGALSSRAWWYHRFRLCFYFLCALVRLVQRWARAFEMHAESIAAIQVLC